MTVSAKEICDFNQAYLKATSLNKISDAISITKSPGLQETKESAVNTKAGSDERDNTLIWRVSDLEKITYYICHCQCKLL